jgi:hypothetical protein
LDITHLFVAVTSSEQAFSTRSLIGCTQNTTPDDNFLASRIPDQIDHREDSLDESSSYKVKTPETHPGSTLLDSRSGIGGRGFPIN